MYWFANWIWGVPLIVLTVLIHSFALFAMHNRFVKMVERHSNDKSVRVTFPIFMGAAVLLVTVLLAAEAAILGAAYLMLGALPDSRSAILYSLNAMTTYGHASLMLAPRWQMLGALEALNGMILFGLTTAFLFTLLRRALEFGGTKSD